MRRAAALLLGAWAAAAWAWLLLHLLGGFAMALREERELGAEARMLLESSMCGLPRSFPLSGGLVRCEDARAVLRRYPAAAAAERVLAGFVTESARAARRELTNALLFAGGAAAGVVLLGRRATAGLVADALEAARARRERAALSEMQRAKGGVLVPILHNYHARGAPLGYCADEDDGGFKEE